MGERDRWLEKDDPALLAQCAVDTYRASGPGGQHRNKTSSAVRLRHRPSGLTVIAEEERSQHANKVRAIKRLRMAIALKAREATGETWTPPTVLRRYVTRTGRLAVSTRNCVYPLIVAAVMDVLAAHDGRLREAAATLGLSTAQLSRFVVRDGKVLDGVNRLRRGAGLRVLSSRK